MEGDQWQKPEKLPSPINLENYTSTQPALGKTNKSGSVIIFFVSDRPGSRGGTDIWVTEYDSKKGTFKNPVDLVNKVNSPGDECSPFYDHSEAVHAIQEGLRGVVRLPDGTAHSLDTRAFPIPVMGKTGTTSDFRDALFVGSTYGASGITVAVRIGYDDNHPLGRNETGGRAALPIFREVMLKVYRDQLVGRAPRFPREIEDGIDKYLAAQSAQAQAGASSTTATVSNRTDTHRR